MSPEDILWRLIDDLRTTLEPFEASGLHKVCGPECESCALGERILEDIEEAEDEITRLRLGITVAK